MFLPNDHTFVICAYKESRYLEECVRSLFKQSIKTAIIVTTSTPGPCVESVAGKYCLPLYINEGETGIAEDWNFALSCAKTKLVTLAHQDDVYDPFYVEEMLNRMNKTKEPIIFSTNYAELRGYKKIFSNRLLNIKKIMRIPMRLFPESVLARRMSLAFGDPICCPSVTYVREMIIKHPFRKGLLASLDWQQWEELSREKGSFAYSNKPLIYHRIHEESETSRVIQSLSRTDEDYQMFLKFWPKPIAKVLTKLYSFSEASNAL